jgi:hypothetical protein
VNNVNANTTLTSFHVLNNKNITYYHYLFENSDVCSTLLFRDVKTTAVFSVVTKNQKLLPRWAGANWEGPAKRTRDSSGSRAAFLELLMSASSSQHVVARHVFVSKTKTRPGQFCAGVSASCETLAIAK